MTPRIVSLIAEMAQVEGVTVDDAGELLLRRQTAGNHRAPRGASRGGGTGHRDTCSEVASFIDGTNLRVDCGSVASI
jgi:hypothetical protein